MATEGDALTDSNVLQPAVKRRKMRPRTFRVVHSVSGQEISLDHISHRINDELTAEWLLGEVATVLKWPVSYVSLMIGSKLLHYRYTGTFLSEINVDDEVLTIQAYKWPSPEFFADGLALCSCDFGRCCCRCMVPRAFISDCCGNTGCCRCGDCEHPCCQIFAGQRKGFMEDFENIEHGFNHCPKRGCLPWWRHTLSDCEAGRILSSAGRILFDCLD